MTKKIPKSALGKVSPVEFAAAVQFHSDNVRFHQEHCAAIVAGDKERVPYPAPDAPLLVNEALGPDGNPDFEIIDDGPTPEQLLEVARAGLLAKISAEHQCAHRKCISPAKQRLAIKRVAQIRKDDVERAKVYAQEQAENASVVEKAARLVGLSSGPSAEEITAAGVARRPSEDAAFMAEQERIDKQLENISDHALGMMAEVEDLPDIDACKAWTMTPFPEA